MLLSIIALLCSVNAGPAIVHIVDNTNEAGWQENVRWQAKSRPAGWPRGRMVPLAVSSSAVGHVGASPEEGVAGQRRGGGFYYG
jgi:hypothetical protein|tara:strand:+ start:396 stop:647 length:252 start_codon:yes stop_codon:yes gene_type:complete